MEESSTYQLILRRGQRDAARRIVLRLGQVRFGLSADKVVTRTIESITDLDRLCSLAARVLTATSWEELLAAP
jgi:hypothetical protein